MLLTPWFVSWKQRLARTLTGRVPRSRKRRRLQTFGIQRLEDRLLLVADFGDAPTALQSGFASSYPTVLADDGARHSDTGPRLGSSRDTESDGQADASANLDDTTGVGDDEDGITFVSTLVASASSNTTSSVTVRLENPDAVSNRLDAWIDFNRDGDWLDAGEQIFSNESLGTTAGNVTLSFTIPAGASVGTTYARFRLSTAGGLSATGSADDGEVEDYAVSLVSEGSAASVNVPAGGGTVIVEISSGDLLVRLGSTTLLRQPASGSGTVIVQGTDAGNDTLNLDFSNGNPIPAGGLTFHGGSGGNDSLTVTGGSTTTVTHVFSNANDGSITLAGALAGTISYTGLEPITDNLSATDRVFTFNGGTETITLSDATGANMTIDSTLGESVTFANPTNSLTINAGSEDDTIHLQGVDAAYIGALTVNGDDGNDAASFQTNPTNLSSGALTVAAENVSLTQAVTAGSATITADTINVAAALTANGGITLQPDDDADTIGLGTGAGTFSLSEAELTNLASTGTVTIGRATGTGAVTVADSGDGNLDLSSEAFALVLRGGSISVTALNAGINAVTLTANTGAITDGGDSGTDVSAGLVTLTAVSGIGAGNALETNVTTVVASTSAPGNIRLSDANGLTLGSAGSGLATFSGDIDVTAAGTITVSEAVNARGNGNVTLTASSGDIQLQANVLSTAATSGSAGDGNGTLTLDSTTGALTTNGSGMLQATAGKLNLQAATGAGSSGNRLLTDVAEFAADLSASGGIFVTEANDLAIATIGSQVGVSLPGALFDLQLNSGTLTVPDNLSTHSVRNNNGLIRLTLEDLAISTGNANQAFLDAAGAMVIQNLTAGREIDLGSNTAGKLSLSSAEMNKIVVGTVIVGRNDALAAGTITISDNVNASGGGVVLKTGAGVTGSAGGISTNNVAIYSGGPVTMTAASNIGTLAISAAGQDVTFVEGNGLTIATTGGIDGITARNVAITTNAGDLIVDSISGIANEIDASGTVALTAAANDALLKINLGANVRSVSGNHVYTADKMNLSGTITATGRIVTLQNSIGADAIHLGASDDTAANTLQLSEGELNSVTAATLRVGSSTAGALTVISDVAPLNIANLHLISGSSLTGTAGGIGNNLNVAFEAGGTITVTDSTTNLNTLAVSAAGQNVTIVEANGFTVGDVDGVLGVTGQNISLTATTGNVTVSNGAAANDLAASGTVSLETSADNALLTIAAGAVISGTAADHTYTADKLDLQGTIIATGRNVTLQSKTAGDTINLGSSSDNTSNSVLELADAELDRITASKIIVGSANAGSITISDAIAPATTPNLTLTNGGDGSVIFSGLNASITVTGTVTVALNSAGAGGITAGAGATDLVADHLDITTGSGGIGAPANLLTFDVNTLTTNSGGNGSQYLSESNSVTLTAGGLTVGSGSILLQGGTFTLGGSDRINDGATLVVDGATFAIGANNETVSTLTLKSGSITGTSGVLTSTNTIGVESGSSSAILASTNGLSKTTSGTVVLSAANTYTGDTTISEGTLTVTGSLADTTDVRVELVATYNVAASDTIDGLNGSGSVMLGANTLTLGGNNEASADFAGVISGSGGLTKSGTGTQTLSGTNTYTGATTINAGVLNVNGSITSNVTVNASGTLAGSGTINGSVTGAGATAPGNSTATLTINGSFTQTAASDLNLEIGGTTPGTDFDCLVVNGAVTLAGDLNLTLISGFVPDPTETFRIIDNDGTDAVVGTFNGLGEGALIAVGGTQFRITYVGGTGNDVELSVPTPDIVMNSVTSNGFSTLTVQYQIQHSALPDPLTLRFLQSTETVDTLLSSVTISNAADLTIGTHTLTYTIGTQVKLPGAGKPEVDTDYFLKAIADPANEFPEVDAHPINEDNSVIFAATYFASKKVYVNAGAAADAVTVTYPASRNGNTTLAISGSLNATYTYGYNDATQFRVRTRGGNDTVSVVNLGNVTNRPMLVLGGDGDDVLTGGNGADTINGGAGNDTITGVKGSDSLDGGTGSDRLVETADVNFTLTNSSLTGLGSDTLAGFELVQLTGGTGGKKFTVSGFTGTANLVGGGGSDTIVASKNSNFTLTDSLLQTSDGMNASLTGFSKAALTGGVSANTFQLSSWTGTGTLSGGSGADTLFVSRNADMTLTSKSLMTSGFGTLKLSDIESAELTGGAGNNTFTVSGWVGGGKLIGGGGTDTVVANRNANFTLSNTQLVASNGLTMDLSGITVAQLTGGKADNSFTVTGWTGTGSVTGGGGTDTLIATLDDNATLSDRQFVVTNGMSITISGLGVAVLTTDLVDDVVVSGGWSSASVVRGTTTVVWTIKRTTR